MSNSTLLKGQDYEVSYDDVVISHRSSISISLDQNQIETSDSDSSRASEFIPGRYNVTFSLSGNWDQSQTSGQLSIIDDLLAGNTGTWKFGKYSTTDAGDVSFSGSGSPSNFSLDASDESVITYSCDVQISGTLTKTVATS